MNRIFELVNSLFDTKIKRYILYVFIGFAILSTAIDILVIGPETLFEELTGTIGCGGGALFFGLLLINTRQLYGFKKWALTVLSLFYIFGGLLFIGLFVIDLLLIMFGN